MEPVRKSNTIWGRGQRQRQREKMSSERRQIEETERERLLKGEASKQNQYNENRLNGRKGYSRRGKIGRAHV